MKSKIKYDKLINVLKNNWPIILILFISFVLHILAFIELGFKYTLSSDDLSYVRSGIEFVKTGRITMHGVLSAQIMPGLTFIIAIVIIFCGTGYKLWVGLKILYMLMGLGTILGAYKTLRLYTNKYISAIPCLFFLVPNYIWMDNLILTETPFIMLFTLLIYHTLKLSIKPNKKDYIMIIIYYIFAVFIRPNIGIYPLFLFIFLLLKKYDFKLLMKQCLIAGIILLLVLTPWTIRNYKVFGKFIPLTYGVGNPLLLGTYQGYGYPEDKELDYIKNVDEKVNEEMKYYLENPDVKDYMTKYYSLEYDGMKAKYRMHEWWNNDKKSMIKSYVIHKPKILITYPFYWEKILNFDYDKVYLINKIELIITLICAILILIDRRKIKELLLLLLTYISQIALYAYTFAFDRYGISLLFMRYIIIGFGISIVYNKFIRRSINESINDNTRIQRRVKH